MSATNANNLQSPTELPLVDSIGSDPTLHGHADDVGNNKVKMKKQLGLVEGCAIILGIIFGSGKC